MTMLVPVQGSLHKVDLIREPRLIEVHFSFSAIYKSFYYGGEELLSKMKQMFASRYFPTTLLKQVAWGHSYYAHNARR